MNIEKLKKEDLGMKDLQSNKNNTTEDRANGDNPPKPKGE